ncbi:hypothetical protein KPH14_004363 [Odynerus spinipes]|uniref:Uncharacterized protein n=1 Tax=Odynerus spinipes TaxID=1348599 RepID=A0AAD9VW46_9HYME|nr:hypothetical protein KPH14_004363 [Odynerus spinipes]
MDAGNNDDDADYYDELEYVRVFWDANEHRHFGVFSGPVREHDCWDGVRAQEARQTTVIHVYACKMSEHTDVSLIAG